MITKSEEEKFEKFSLPLEADLENEIELLTLVLTPEEKLCLVNELVLRFKKCEETNDIYLANLNDIFKKLIGEDSDDYLSYLAKKTKEKTDEV